MAQLKVDVCFKNLEKAAEPNAIISDVFWSLPAQEQASPIVTGSHFLGRLSPWLALCPHMTRASASNESFCSALMSNSLDCYLEGSHKWKVQRSGEKKLDSLDQSMTIMTIMILLYTHVYFCMSMYLSIYSIFLFIYLSISLSGILFGHRHPTPTIAMFGTCRCQDLSL